MVRLSASCVFQLVDMGQLSGGKENAFGILSCSEKRSAAPVSNVVGYVRYRRDARKRKKTTIAPVQGDGERVSRLYRSAIFGLIQYRSHRWFCQQTKITVASFFHNRPARGAGKHLPQ